MNLHRFIAVLVFGFCLLPSVSFSASFDCKKAATAFEKAVCADPKVSKLDEDLAAGYNKAIAALSKDGQKILRDGQRRWLSYANDFCLKYKNDQQNCLELVYERRIQDMDTAAKKIGPFVFSRIDYFYVKDDPDFGRPSQGETSYPRIDNPTTEALKKWNSVMAPVTANGDYGDEETGCDNFDGFTIISATDSMISAELTNWMFGHGAAHGYGGTNGKIYILKPDLHPFKTEDLFSDSTNWRNFVNKRCIEAAGDLIKPEDREQYKDLGTDPSTWSFTHEGLAINIGAGSVLGPMDEYKSTTIRWSDLKPYLAPSAPIPQ